MVEDKQCLTFGNTTICVFRGHVMIYIYHNMSVFWLAVFARPDAIKTVKPSFHMIVDDRWDRCDR